MMGCLRQIIWIILTVIYNLYKILRKCFDYQPPYATKGTGSLSIATVKTMEIAPAGRTHEGYVTNWTMHRSTELEGENPWRTFKSSDPAQNRGSSAQWRWNRHDHSLFWHAFLSQLGGRTPTRELAAAIDANVGSLMPLKRHCNKAAAIDSECRLGLGFV